MHPDQGTVICELDEIHQPKDSFQYVFFNLVNCFYLNFILVKKRTYTFTLIKSVEKSHESEASLGFPYVFV